MVILAVQRGDLVAVRELLGAGARVDGNPDGDENPLGQACWRGQVAIAEALLARGASTEFRDGGCAIGAALHGSRHCQDPEGGPTMATVTEINPEPYAKLCGCCWQPAPEYRTGLAANMARGRRCCSANSG